MDAMESRFLFDALKRKASKDGNDAETARECLFFTNMEFALVKLKAELKRMCGSEFFLCRCEFGEAAGVSGLLLMLRGVSGSE